MIAKLTGLVDFVGVDYVILDVHGVGYRVFCSSQTLARCSNKGLSTSLLIETQVREDHIHLFGFADAIEKESFGLLTSVQGVGAKVGLAILSVLKPQDLKLALATGDSKALIRASGVGPKLALRIVTELKEKATVFSRSSDFIVSDDSKIGNVLSEAISALTNLGYGRSEAGMVVGTLYQNNSDIQTADLIRMSLKEIGKNNG